MGFPPPPQTHRDAGLRTGQEAAQEGDSAAEKGTPINLMNP